MPQPDLADRAVVAKLERDARSRERQDAAVLVGIMDTTAGRQFICRKLEGAHVFATSFSTNPLTMAFNEGERNRGLDLLNDLMRHCPDQYVAMMRERNARDAAIERSVSDDNRPGEADPEPTLFDEFEADLASGDLRYDGRVAEDNAQ